MPHGISAAIFVRTSLGTCDVFVMATSYLPPEHAMTPEQLIETVRPWFLDAETVWSRIFQGGVRS